ncbi:E3 ubiquitin-protein ligase SINA-like 7, partial [Capsella rubella]|uniref:E3 ubiquitin-protein ligase SINA-like 7 n=1 Tax=Capsella rubella TaxID=81985 RepID=UPI000CD4E4CD
TLLLCLCYCIRSLSVLCDTHLQKKQRTEDKTRPAMLDFDVFDCPVCFEPLTIPIFQCDNGHLACSSFCTKLRSKCPSCALTIGRIRCRAMESVLESILIPCPNATFGCTKKVSYGKESTHVNECVFSQCSCPVPGCNYNGSSKDLFFHYNLSSHPLEYINVPLKCDTSFSFRMAISNKILIKRELMMELVFVVQCFKEPYGVYVTIRCIAPSAPEIGKFSYHLSYTVDRYNMTFTSPEVKRVLEVSLETPREDFMLIPNSFLRGQMLYMKVCIKELKQE